MSRYWTRPPIDTVVLTARRLALAALVIPATGICAAQPATARVTPPPLREGLAAFRVHGPGGGGGQVIKGGRASGSQSRSGAGRFNQSLNGAVSPTFVMGQSQQPITKTRSLDLQAAFCGSQPTICATGQNMPIHWRN
ncbi:hypothetical protein [Microbispora catharanthi]|uniref:Uncharacterized protein n=1 Tax=Microbispora catharanthi TaxID=1712871 RepID=A0A5N6BZF6_9ACTN|nr:hypothetical protein [Microbispora catharanthi]KAB8185869.1 hypothetical protein FH610_008820 [Microbispora catharanthi]